jgi:hypothetical protein
MRREPPVRIREGLGVKLPWATRLVIYCRGTADKAMAVMREMMSKLKWTVNETKTHLCHRPGELFDFWGYTLGQNYNCRPGKFYLNARRSRRKIVWLCRKIGELTTRKSSRRALKVQIGGIKRKLRGLVQLFSHRDGEQSLPEHRQSCLPLSVSVVVREVQAAG